jgi:hypothetical protein
MKTIMKASLLTLILLIIGLVNIPASTQQQLKGRILFDETLNEYVESRVDTGYSELAKELRNSGYAIDTLTAGPISYEKISQYSVFAITAPFTPPKSLTNDEIQAIKQFVSEGGGLFIAALGWSWVSYAKVGIELDPANQIGGEFGIKVNDDIIYDPTNNDGDPSRPIFHEFAIHPITNGLSEVGIEVPSSLSISGNAQPIVWGDDDSYALRETIRTYPEGTHPPFVAIAEFGRGRVVCVGQDGIFHDRNLHRYDNLKLALNIFDWLSQAGRQVVGTVSDEIGDAGIQAPPYVDIVEASVSQTDQFNIELKMKVAGSIPLSFEKNQQYVGYIWYLDTDRDSSTGWVEVGASKEHNVGVEVLAYYEFVNEGWNRRWMGGLRGPEIGERPLNVRVSEDTIIAIIPLADLGNPSSFNWYAIAHEDRRGFDVVPNTGYATFYISTVSPTVTSITKTFDMTVTKEEVFRTVIQPTSSILNHIPYLILPIIALIGAFAILARRRRRVETREVKRKPEEMEIKVLHKETNKLVTLEVRPENTIGSIVEAVVEALKLPRDETYVLLYEGKKFDQNEYSTMLSDAGIEDGDQLELQKRLKG